MEDVLSVVRQFNLQKKEIVTDGDRVVFGDSSWPKNTQTSYVVWGTGRKGHPEQHYTLDSVLFLLANEHLAHPSYVLLATAEGVPVVRKPDRKALLSYLHGEEEGSTSERSVGGSSSAFLETDLQGLTVERKRAADEAPSSPSSSPDEASSPKRTRVEDEERECPAVRLEAHRRGDADPIGSSPIGATTTSVEKEEEAGGSTLTSLAVRSEDGDDDENRETEPVVAGTSTDEHMKTQQADVEDCGTSQPTRDDQLLSSHCSESCPDADVDDLDERCGIGTPSPAERENALFHHNVVTLKNRRSVDAGDVTGSQGNVSRETVWGLCRTTVLQSTKNQDFSRNILAILQSVRAKEKKEEQQTHQAQALADLQARSAPPSGALRACRSAIADPSSSSVRTNQPVSASERLTGGKVFNDVDTGEGFYEDTTLTSVTEGSSTTTPASPRPLLRPVPQSRAQQHLSKRPNRVSRTPIIVVPAGSTSLITLANARDLLQDATFVTAEEKRRRRGGGVLVPPRDREVLLQRRKEEDSSTTSGVIGATTVVPYRVTDHPLRLTPRDWERVVAVFVQGPAWQFKGWPRLLMPDGSPADIFARIPAFHLKYDEAQTDPNVRLQNVTVLEVSRQRRHLDRPAVLRFWETLDRHMARHKPHLRY